MKHLIGDHYENPQFFNLFTRTIIDVDMLKLVATAY